MRKYVKAKLSFMIQYAPSYDATVVSNILYVIVSDTQLVSFDRSNNTSTIEVKMDRSVIEEKFCFKILVLTFSPKLD